MSGVAGGTRIKLEYVDKTFKKFQGGVLSRIPGYESGRLTGSAKIKSRDDYGDLDLVVCFKGNDKAAVKHKIIDFISTLPDNVIVPFQSKKYFGRKYYNSGEMISVLYPIDGADGYVQIDNIIALSKEEADFKEQFLDLPAEKQGLLIALAKVILLERVWRFVCYDLGIGTVPSLENKQEYEFNLSSSKLTLRIVTMDNGKEVCHNDAWWSYNWNCVEELFSSYNIKGTFEELLDSMDKQVSNERSRRRIPGCFKSMISVKSGEVGTLKEKIKLEAIQKVEETFKH